MQIIYLHRKAKEDTFAPNFDFRGRGGDLEPDTEFESTSFFKTGALST